jgi:transcriptional regulator with XRE-family HTH domain
MNKRDRARLTMSENTNQFLDENEAEVKDLPRYADTKSDLELKIEAANKAAVDADDGAGDAAKKEVARVALVDAASEVLKPIKLMAVYTNDVKLENKADITNSTLDNMSMKALATRCGVVLELANAIDATEYGQTPEKIALLEQVSTDFKVLVTKPRLAIAERKEANARFSDCVDDTVDVLNEKMDLTIDLLEKENPELYNAYQAVRIIVG